MCACMNSMMVGHAMITVPSADGEANMQSLPLMLPPEQTGCLQIRYQFQGTNINNTSLKINFNSQLIDENKGRTTLTNYL